MTQTGTAPLALRITHRRVGDDGTVTVVARDKAAGITTVHTTAPRGGGRWIGRVWARNTLNGEAVRVDTVSRPADHDDDTPMGAYRDYGARAL